MDDPWPDDDLRPRAWGKPHRTTVPVFIAVHGAYHVLARRLLLDTRDLGISAAEAAVMATIRREPAITIAAVRQRTGLRPSTLDSLLDRLAGRGLIVRRSPRSLRGEVVVDLTAGGDSLAHQAATLLSDLDDELGVFLARETLAAADAIFEAARALGVPGTAADI